LKDAVNGGPEVVVTLLEASEKVDRGDIWGKYCYKIPAYFLYEDIIKIVKIVKIVNQAHIDLMSLADDNYGNVKPTLQKSDVTAIYFPRRTPADSEISAFKSIAEKFDIIRASERNRYPSFFHLRGEKFKVIVERYDDKRNNH
jgi:methionyl-tRNA formyltransferase